MGVDDELQKRLTELAEDPTAAEARMAVSDAIGEALAHVGQVLWVTGAIVGPDRKSRQSPFGFGNDGAVGVATVAQIGGELAQGASELLKAGNWYAACALIRQVVEVQYLAEAFSREHEEAAAWLRADRERRLAFWSPQKLRQRAAGLFRGSDYWHHCDVGGHPTMEGTKLLPGHRQIEGGYLWVDLAVHLVGIWEHVVVSTERLLNGPIPGSWKLPDVRAAIDKWRATDGLAAAMRDLNAILRANEHRHQSGPGTPGPVHRERSGRRGPVPARRRRRRLDMLGPSESWGK